ncbi:protein required for normal CLN1 and CLN2 G1 cyclin expression [Gaertneriomyces sp. JEL0708]|nr:protein required for normal CLN1 and CLN2 G1 cyclin expression [Gaertneriomyces sp. JEL0708]
MATTATIDIPIGPESEVLEVSRRDLRDNESFVFQILNEEDVALWVYIEIAIEYWKQGYRHLFEEALKAGLRRTGRGVEATERRHHVQILNLLSSYYIECAKDYRVQVTDDRKIITAGSVSMTREQYILEATDLINHALRLDRDNVDAIVNSGNVRLARLELDEALKAFKGAVSRRRTCIPALLGEASIHCAKGQYDKALPAYQTILTLKPDLQPDVRVAIGICYYRLGAVEQAYLAFERALKRNPENSDAAMLLSIIEWNKCRDLGVSARDKHGLPQSANSRLIDVYKREGRHPLLAAQMAYRKFIRGEFNQAVRFADAVLETSNTPVLRAEALCCKAKAYQAQLQYADALKSFEQAVAVNPSSLVANFGLAAMQLYNNRVDNACQALESILEKDPENQEALMRLASYYSQSRALHQKALEVYHRLNVLLESVTKDKDGGRGISDPLVLIDIAGVLEQTKPKDALQLYLDAARILQTQGMIVPPQLYNNIGVLFHIIGQTEVPKKVTETSNETSKKNTPYHSAAEYYSKALTTCENDEVTKVTVKYNTARLHEAMGESEAGLALYHEILSSHPAYLDCHLRLGALHLETGAYDEALAEFKLIADTHEKDAPSRLMMGQTYLAHDNKQEAKRTFDQVLRTINNQDVYALVALGNLQMGFAKSARHDPKEREEWLIRSLKLYDAALKVDPRNAYAATGVGVYFAEIGRLQEAVQIFSQIEQTAGNMAAASVNLAHSLLALDEKDAKTAIPLYEKAVKKGLDKDPYLLQAMSRAYYIQARHRKDDAAMRSALYYIQRAAQCNPGDSGIWFNMALVKQHMAVVLNDQPIEKRDLSNMKRAMKGIDAAERIFEGLAARKPETRPNYNITHAGHRKTYCKDVRKLSEKKIHETTTLERQRQERRQIIKEEQRKREETKLRREQEEQERKQREDEERERRNAEIQAKLQADLRRARETEAEEEKHRSDRKMKRERDSEDDDPDVDGTSKPRKRTKKPKGEGKRRRGEDPSGASEDETGGMKRGRRQVNKRSGPSKQYQSKEFISDSDISDGELGKSEGLRDTEVSEGDLAGKTSADSDEDHAAPGDDNDDLSQLFGPSDDDEADMPINRRPRTAGKSKGILSEEEDD